LPIATSPLKPDSASWSASPADQVDRFYTETLGCKLNQFDTVQAEAILRRGGFLPTTDPRSASLILINTCSVTTSAEHDARKAARRLRRLNPSARMIATGCYATRDVEELRRLGVFEEVLSHRDRDRLPAVLLGRDACSTAPLELSFPDPARAFLKVQSGCDLACSYCIIPTLRGASRSESIADVLQSLRDLVARGVREVGLTGVNVGMWGLDLTPRQELIRLIDAILAADLPLRVRLNSLEPRTVTEPLLQAIRLAPQRLVPHIQIPLQSGSDTVLARMSRNYRTAHYRGVIERAKELVPDICLGADVIVGFPGETSAEFEQTERFIASLPLDYLHVFRYSPRPGTRAAHLEARVPGDQLRQRVTLLTALGRSHAARFRQRQLGTRRSALILAGRSAEGLPRALTDNYIEALVPAAISGTVVDIQLIRHDPDRGVVFGESAKCGSGLKR
jgi:threonylcarbamoyladenosine tRNA methylthiotransferase MtaB